MSYSDYEFYEDLRYGDVDPDLASLQRELRYRRGIDVAKAANQPISQQLEVKLIRNYQGRSRKGWCVVEWSNQFFYPKRDISAWVRENVADEDYMQCDVAPRYFFRHESDAILCYLAFK
jgi:hypothetical protein